MSGLSTSELVPGESILENPIIKDPIYITMLSETLLNRFLQAILTKAIHKCIEADEMKGRKRARRKKYNTLIYELKCLDQVLKYTKIYMEKRLS
jgi:hypothetical protein